MDTEGTQLEVPLSTWSGAKARCTEKLTWCIWFNLSDKGGSKDIYTQHKIVLSRLEDFGMSGDALEWMTSYLHERSQSAVIDGVTSLTAILQYGVPYTAGL